MRSINKVVFCPVNRWNERIIRDKIEIYNPKTLEEAAEAAKKSFETTNKAFEGVAVLEIHFKETINYTNNGK
jgi:hypothetical protein